MLVLGGLACALLGWVASYLTVASVELLTLDLGDALSVLSTLIITWAIGMVFQRQFSEVRAEKEILMSQVREVRGCLCSAREVFVHSYFDGTSAAKDRQLISALRLVSTHITALEKACDLASHKYRSNAALGEARNQFRRYRRVVADFGRSSYTDAEYGEAESVFGGISQSLLLFTMHINKT